MSRDGKILLIGGLNGQLAVYNIPTGVILGTVEVNSGAVAMNPTGTVAYVGPLLGTSPISVVDLTNYTVTVHRRRFHRHRLFSNRSGGLHLEWESPEWNFVRDQHADERSDLNHASGHSRTRGQPRRQVSLHRRHVWADDANLRSRLDHRDCHDGRRGPDANVRTDSCTVKDITQPIRAIASKGQIGTANSGPSAVISRSAAFRSRFAFDSQATRAPADKLAPDVARLRRELGHRRPAASLS